MYDRIKGFRDFYPGEMAARRATIDTLEDAARRYGFREVATPALERAELWTDKAATRSSRNCTLRGPGWTPRGDDAGTDAHRRADGRRQTTGAVEADQVVLDAAVLALRTGPAGRQREFYQTNVDIFGSSEPEADAEMGRRRPHRPRTHRRPVRVPNLTPRRLRRRPRDVRRRRRRRRRHPRRRQIRQTRDCGVPRPADRAGCRPTRPSSSPTSSPAAISRT